MLMASFAAFCFGWRALLVDLEVVVAVVFVEGVGVGVGILESGW